MVAGWLAGFFRRQAAARQWGGASLTHGQNEKDMAAVLVPVGV
jgi:hypothetical protein